MRAQFRIGKIETNVDGCVEELEEFSEQFKKELESFEYFGQTRSTNSTQLDIHFDNTLLDLLDSKGWHCIRNPRIKTNGLAGHSGAEEADAILQLEKMGDRFVLEIEKSKKETIWFDFIKLWMFIESGQAKCGIIVAPFNYAHKLGIWNLFDEASRYKFFLQRFAGVPSEKMALISIVGYEQRIFRDGEYRYWDKSEFIALKKGANRGGNTAD